MASQEKIDKLKDFHRKKMDSYAKEVREHVERYSPKPCDYLTFRREMYNYHRGAYNVLIELERS